MAPILSRILPKARPNYSSCLFDAKYYKTSYPDVAKAGVDPFNHFMQVGWQEGRNPSNTFVTLFYLDANLRGQKVNPLEHFRDRASSAKPPTQPETLEHYLQIQAAVARPYFAESYYLAQADVPADIDPLLHYLSVGWRQGHLPRRDFDVDAYIDRHRFIRQLDISPLYHFASLASRQDRSVPAASLSRQVQNASNGLDEKRIAKVIAAEFDADFYLRRNIDVFQSGIDPLQHYIRHGWREGRKPNALFDPHFYMTNPDVAELGLEPFYHFIRFGRQLGLRGNSVGAALYPPLRAPADDAWLSVRPARETEGAACIVLMPVYKGRDETLAAIHAVLSAEQETHFALHVINDSSPDAALSTTLGELAEHGLFSYEINPSNEGFVRTVNRGFRRFRGQHFALLNTDALVSGAWLDRMLAHADRDPTIATITPFSNNATIFSYPLINENNVIEMELNAAGLDQLASRCNRGRLSDMPTGVGFCMFVSARSLERLDGFDEDAFGKGYGEENDYCLRAAKAGLRNVLAEDIFVYHVGEVSFGKPNPSKVAPGQAALIKKHPEYPELIRQHLQADVSEVGRIRLDLARIAAALRGRAVVFIYHALQGGIVTHLEEEERRLGAEGLLVVHIRVGVGGKHNVLIGPPKSPPIYAPNLRAMPFAHLRRHLEDFLGWLAPSYLHIHSLVGFDWDDTESLLDLIATGKFPYRFTLHDYSVVCHRNDLVLPTQRYCGLPDVDVCRRCMANDRHYVEDVDPARRRSRFAAFLEGAQQVTAPSQDIAARLRRVGARYAINVVPHAQDKVSLRPRPRPQPRPLAEIATIGAIGPHKGSRVLLSLARDAKLRALPIRFTIVGYSDIPTELTELGVTETGQYAGDDEARERVAALDPAFIFLPSIWPETYCYTLSLAFTAGVLPVVFDLGAQAERVRAAGFGEVLPYTLIDEISALNDRLIELACLS